MLDDLTTHISVKALTIGRYLGTQWLAGPASCTRDYSWTEQHRQPCMAAGLGCNRLTVDQGGSTELRSKSGTVRSIRQMANKSIRMGLAGRVRLDMKMLIAHQLRGWLLRLAVRSRWPTEEWKLHRIRRLSNANFRIWSELRCRSTHFHKSATGCSNFHSPDKQFLAFQSKHFHCCMRTGLSFPSALLLCSIRDLYAGWFHCSALPWPLHESYERVGRGSCMSNCRYQPHQRWRCLNDTRGLNRALRRCSSLRCMFDSHWTI